MSATISSQGASVAGVAGLEWQNVVSDDLARDASRYPHVTVMDNTVAPWQSRAYFHAFPAVK